MFCKPIAYAHSKPGLPKERWHALEDHLQGTAKPASDFAGKFGGTSWGWYAGLWHDLGKFASDWQFGILREMFGKNLDGNESVQPCVSCFVDLAHPARADRLEDFVGAEFRSGGDGHGFAFGSQL